MAGFVDVRNRVLGQGNSAGHRKCVPELDSVGASDHLV